MGKYVYARIKIKISMPEITLKQASCERSPLCWYIQLNNEIRFNKHFKYDSSYKENNTYSCLLLQVILTIKQLISVEFGPLCPGYDVTNFYFPVISLINNAFNSELLFSYYSSGWTLCKIAFSFTFPRHFPCQCINFLLAEQSTSTALETTSAQHCSVYIWYTQTSI